MHETKFLAMFHTNIVLGIAQRPEPEALKMIRGTELIFLLYFPRHHFMHRQCAKLVLKTNS